MAVNAKEMAIIAAEIACINDPDHRKTAMIVVNNALGMINPRFDSDRWAVACGCAYSAIPCEGKADAAQS